MAELPVLQLLPVQYCRASKKGIFTVAAHAVVLLIRFLGQLGIAGICTIGPPQAPSTSTIAKLISNQNFFILIQFGLQHRHRLVAVFDL